ncbi:MAG TPA: 5'/3'-nucleotidase SurE [Thermoanaerobaculia bacterium]|nr:5'/3'-nucleotidase SurE [Thermoanaerobaculia bacterium]HUM30291.1 5'/3'-nucleotidase SurE [Thermoanaerobaculia bacterium]HXK68413.1 5'/3'-nucleotidase SurE [Thermoanaerobaculia bacterium]
MIILVTNDDGVFAEGIRHLAEALAPLGDIWIVAPDRERSAASHALTLDSPLRIQEVDQHRYAVNGTPTDCVNVGVLHILKDRKPDLIVSGINFGLNIGDDVTYSGTVSAAFEGTILGIPSLAVSQEVGSPMPYERSAAFIREFIESLMQRDLLKNGLLLNINLPFEDPIGVRFTRLGKRQYSEGVMEKVDPRGKKYYWIGGIPRPTEIEEGTDFHALTHRHISITPLHLDLTDYTALDRMKDLSFKD